jgi:hypothetical protein
MHNLKTTKNQLNSNGYWSKPVNKLIFLPTISDVELFDQTGYDLTILEQLFAESNQTTVKVFGRHRHSISQDWITQDTQLEGAVLNHSRLFERKGYTDEALLQLNMWSDRLPLVNKISAIRPKWGLDFSMDYVDRKGNAFEILHWEYDSFDYEEIMAAKTHVEKILLNVDWDYASNELLLQKDKWYNLEYFPQSNWKCDYFGIPHEKFKIVTWK